VSRSDQPVVRETDPILRLSELSKTFPGTRALDAAALEIQRGEVHALVGQNGSGKSTLIKILAGYHEPDPGAHAELAGEPFDLGRTVPEAMRFVHQELGVILELDAVDNLALRGGYARGRGGRVLWREQRRRTLRMLERFAVDLDLRLPLGDATPVERTVVAIAAAIQGWEPRDGVLVLDEPTALLPHEEVDRLFAMVAELRRIGTSILYVSHRLDEIFRIADRVTVLRGGRVVVTKQVAELDERSLARLMVGEDVDPAFRVAVPRDVSPEPVLELHDVHGRWLRGVDLTVRRGEIVGIAGLAGSGMEELPYVIAQLGIPFVPADRAQEAIVAEFNLRENMSLGVLDSFSTRGKLDKGKERARIEDWAGRLGVVTAGFDAPISSLSGGNQQKVVVGRCLMRDAGVIVLAEPTAGVDIASRVAIYELIAGFVRDGLTVVISSSDAGDLRAMCTRIVVLRNGRVGGELDGDGVTEHELARMMEGAPA
jgi:ABC-type sugar transport system ATPase subunit